MPAIVPATKAAPQMILGGENHQAVLVEIIIAGTQSRIAVRRAPMMKRPHASAADAPAIALLRRHASQQLSGKFNRRAPARAFVRGGGAELAIVGSAAQRTTRGVVFRWRRNRSFGCAGHESRTEAAATSHNLTTCAAHATSADRRAARATTSPVPARRRRRRCMPDRSRHPIAES